ncbi:hypothetical protein [Urechidicola vernalis]|uniref:Uncharacterized protein n=1 Tax=Urechidicola vernalis TaxID=3075600 RepID=A0ABU2Y538_9FLAO|nr:hypothetical protein [Urechidicola sp. P050]MDT0552900.1 hypothetical protein [Urechidicola sp. P050]
MSRKIKLIWDFKGPVCHKTAEHHAIHLKEFAQMENLPFYDIGFIEISEMHAITFVIVDNPNMKTYRDTLKPHRGELV